MTRTGSAERKSAIATCNICGGSVDRTVDLRWRKDGYDILRCWTCGLLFRADLPSEAELQEIYGTGYFRADAEDTGGQGYADYLGEEANHRANAVARLQMVERYAARGRLLDVGTAAGFFLAEAQARGWTAVGLEVAEEMAVYGREQLGVDIRRGAFADVALEPESFEAVTMWDYIEHSVDPAGDLRRAALLARPGGVLCLSTGDAASLAARLSRSRWHLLTPRHHNFFFTPAVLGRALGDAGFRVVRAWHPSSLYSLQYLLYKLRTLRDASMFRALAEAAGRHAVGQWAVPVNLYDILTVVARKLPVTE